MDEIKASIVSIKYRNPEHTWIVATMKSDDKRETFMATGDIPYSEGDESIQLYGEWIEDKKYGIQFKVATAHRILPTSTSGLQRYLATSEDIKGVGPVRASKLALHFGSSLLKVLDTCPEKLTACPGISDELAERIAASWKKDSSVRQLALFLAKHGVSPRWASRILKQWGPAEAIEKITNNPYALTAIEGIGFNTADEIATALGRKKDTPERIAAACVYVIADAIQDGNVFLHEFQLIDKVIKLVVPRGKDEAKIREQATLAVTEAISNEYIKVEVINDGCSSLRLLYLPYLYKAEKGLAERIAELNTYNHDTPRRLEGILTEVQKNAKVSFSTKQVSAIRGAFSNRTLVITGGPGTGKTTCTKAICEVAERLHLELLLAAPTGRAAKRLSEVTGRDATTIHRLLKWGEDGPGRTRDNPIEADILIIDESSMLDLELSYKLFEALPAKCSVICIGDVDQLPAVGAGTVLRDIISSGTVPIITLDTIFRQAEASLIVRNAHLIRKGEMPRFPETKGVKENSYVMWIPPNTTGEGGKDDAVWLKEKLSRLVSVNIPEKFGTDKPIDPIKDIQVLVPMKKQSLGTHELNIVLQEALNPNGKEFSAGGKVYRHGDRIMQTRNNYDGGMEVYNGDIGFIVCDRPEDKCVEIDFYGRTVSYPYTSLSDTQLAYAQTIHKAQGSEYRIVVLVMAYQHWPMLERNLLYTANTRAKELCLFIASKGAIERAVKNNPVKERNSYLAQRLKEYMPKEVENA